MKEYSITLEHIKFVPAFKGSDAAGHNNLLYVHGIIILHIQQSVCQDGYVGQNLFLFEKAHYLSCIRK